MAVSIRMKSGRFCYFTRVTQDSVSLVTLLKHAMLVQAAVWQRLREQRHRVARLKFRHTRNSALVAASSHPSSSLMCLLAVTFQDSLP